MNSRSLHRPLTRRQACYGLGATLGSIAFTSMLAADEAVSPLAARAGHLPAKAKRCIFLTMEGGPSHIDTFDPKPKLAELHLQEFVRSGEQKSAMESGKRYYVKSPFRFHRCGQSGADICVNWEFLADCVDDICFYRGCQVDSVNHPTAMYQLNTGNRFGGDPAFGAWTTYGLGSLNQNLPGFIVLPEVSHPQGGAANWGNGFLPAHYQGTALRSSGAPILDLMPRAEITRAHQRMNLDLLAKLNERHHRQHPEHDELAARMQAYELAFRMQAEVPGLLDLSPRTSVAARRIRYWQRTDGRFWPPMPAGPTARGRGRAICPSLRWHLGLARLHRACARQPDPSCGPSDSRLAERPQTTRPVGFDSGCLVRRIRPLTR